MQATQRMAHCDTCSSFTTGVALQAWIEGKENRNSSEEQIRKKIRSKVKASATFRTYPKLNSISTFSRQYVPYEKRPHCIKPRKQKLSHSTSEYSLSSYTNTEDMPISETPKPISHRPTMYAQGTFRPNGRSKHGMLKGNKNRHPRLNRCSSAQSSVVFTSTSKTIKNTITFSALNLAQQHHKRSEKEDKRKREATKIETAKYVAQLYKPLPLWLRSRLGTKTRKTSKWTLIRKSLSKLILTFAANPILSDENKVLRFKIKYILHKLPDFNHFQGENLNTFLSHCSLKCIRAGTKLFVSGSMGKECYLILDGSFILRKRSMNRMQALRNLMNVHQPNKIGQPQQRGWNQVKSQKINKRVPYDVLGMQTEREHKMRFEHNFRMTDCICTKDSVVLTIPFNGWWFMMRLLDQEKKRNAQFLLRHREYFTNLSATSKQHITRILKYHKITNGDALFFQDRLAAHIYLVVDGEIILNHEVVLRMNNQYPINHGTIWERKEITRSFHLLVSTKKKGDWFAVETIDDGTMNLCTASCISHTATILSIPKRELYLFPKEFEQEIRKLNVGFHTRVKDAKDAFKLQYLERIQTINNCNNKSNKIMRRALSMQNILQYNQRGNDKLLVERKNPTLHLRSKHIQTLRADTFGPLHVKAMDEINQMKNQKKRFKRKSKKVRTMSDQSLMEVVQNMNNYNTKHKMRKSSRFSGNSNLHMMVERRAKQSFVINKVSRIYRTNDVVSFS